MLGYTALEFGLGTAVMTVMVVVGAAGGQAIVTRLGFRAVAVGLAQPPVRATLPAHRRVEWVYAGRGRIAAAVVIAIVATVTVRAGGDGSVLPA